MFSLCLAHFSCTSPKSGIQVQKSKVDFYNAPHISQVKEKASKEIKLIFVYVYRKACKSCEIVYTNLFSDTTLSEFMNEHFVNYLLHENKLDQLELDHKNDIDVYPILFFLDQNGEVLGRHNGVIHKQEFLDLAKRAITLRSISNKQLDGLH